jgi:hypothetical protein
MASWSRVRRRPRVEVQPNSPRRRGVRRGRVAARSSPGLRWPSPASAAAVTSAALAGPSSSQRRATPRRARQPAPCPALAHAHPVHVGHRGAPAVGTKAPTMLKLAEPVNGSETPTVDGHWAIAAAAGIADAPVEGHPWPWAGLGKAQPVDQLPDQPPPTPARAHQRSGVGLGAARPRIVASIQPPCTPMVTLTSWMLQEPTQDALVAALLTASTTSSTTSPGMAAGSCCKLVRPARRSPARQVGEPATELSGYRPLPALRPSWPSGGSWRPG